MSQANPDELQLLAFLDHLKENDPELYQKTMLSMQSELGQGASPDLPNVLSALKSSSTSLPNSDIASGLNMPGLTKVLGKDGVEDKVTD